MWLTGRLAPDFKTIANFRRDNGAAIRAACAQFIVLCRQLGLFTRSVVAIDGSKFKAVNNRDKDFTMVTVAKRMEQVDASIVRYLAALDRADRDESDVAEARTTRIKDKIARLRQQMQALQAMKEKVLDAPDQQISLTDPMATSGRGTGIVGYNVQTAVRCRTSSDRGPRSDQCRPRQSPAGADGPESARRDGVRRTYSSDMKRMIQILGAGALMEAIRT